MGANYRGDVLDKGERLVPALQPHTRHIRTQKVTLRMFAHSTNLPAGTGGRWLFKCKPFRKWYSVASLWPGIFWMNYMCRLGTIFWCRTDGLRSQKHACVSAGHCVSSPLPDFSLIHLVHNGDDICRERIGCVRCPDTGRSSPRAYRVKCAATYYCAERGKSEVITVEPWKLHWINLAGSEERASKSAFIWSNRNWMVPEFF